jgi:hypothetical protein
VDASQIHSEACYLDWLRTHQGERGSKESARKFQRTLSNHLSGVDGRLPFTKQEEEAILQVVRIKQHWPCFPHLSIGLTGYRSKGYYEKRGGATMEPSPRLPFLQPQDVQLLWNFFNGLPQLFTSLAHFGMDATELVDGMYCFLLFKGQSLAMDDLNEVAQELCEAKTQELGPNFLVNVVDLSSKPGGQRFLAQNAKSVEALGQLEGRGFQTLHFQEEIKIMMAQVEACQKMGFPTKVRLWLQSMLVLDLHFVMDADTLLCMQYGLVVQM